METKVLPRYQVSTHWAEPDVSAAYRSGVSLHSHTSMSEEAMTFVHKLLALQPGLRRIFAHYDRKSAACGFQLDFIRGHWRPPLVPRMAHDLECNQIREAGLEPLISITDHDTIAAPQMLRSVASARGIPVSLEWSVPFGVTELHLGVHNLPSIDAYAWTARLAAYTADPKEADLRSLLAELDELPGVLVVLNHPVWDLHKIGADVHKRELARFLELLGRYVHALELNGLRDARENRAVTELAAASGHLLISGGDRHGTEPSACINLSQAGNFREFVDEIRLERRSHILFMNQYRTPWEQRILHSTLDAVTDFPEFAEGWRRWDDRAFHPDRNGEMRPLSQLWENGSAPWPLRVAVSVVRLSRNKVLSRSFGRSLRGQLDPVAELEGLSHQLSRL